MMYNHIHRPNESEDCHGFHPFWPGVVLSALAFAAGSSVATGLCACGAEENGRQRRLQLRASFQPASGDFIFVPAEVMAELVKIGETHLVAEGGLIVFGLIQDIFEEKQDLRGEAGRLRR